MGENSIETRNTKFPTDHEMPLATLVLVTPEPLGSIDVDSI